MRSGHAEVLAANLSFYEAFALGDLAAMDALWCRERVCSCTHPGWLTLTGRELIMRSWRGILMEPADVQCLDPQVHLCGEVAWVTCREIVQGTPVVATNLFVLEQGSWLLAHHHGSPVAAELHKAALKSDFH